MRPPIPPKKKMPTGRMIFMLGVALLLSLLILIFATFQISAPFILAAIAKIEVAQHAGSIIGDIAGLFSGLVLGALELFTGIGVALVAAVGDAVADAIEFFALALVFPVWYLISGIKQSGSKHGQKRFFMSMITFIIGMIPLINILPATLVSVSLNIWSVRKEDAEEMEKYKQKLKKYLESNGVARQQHAERSRAVAVRQRAIHDTAIVHG